MNDLISTLKDFWKTAKWFFLILLAVILTMACFNFAYQTEGNGFYWFVGAVNACVYFFAIYRGWKAEVNERISLKQKATQAYENYQGEE